MTMPVLLLSAAFFAAAAPDPDEVRGWLLWLKSPDENVREAGFRRAAENPAGIAALASLLADTDLGGPAAQAIRNRGSGAVETLLGFLNTAEGPTHETAEQFLADTEFSFDDSATRYRLTKHWMRRLESPSAAARRRAVRGLGRMWDDRREVLPKLRAAVADPDAGVRVEAAAAMQAFGPGFAAAAIPDLAKRVSDPDATVRVAAVRAMAALGADLDRFGPEPTGPLIDALSDGGDDTDRFLAELIAQSVRRFPKTAAAFEAAALGGGSTERRMLLIDAAAESLPADKAAALLRRLRDDADSMIADAATAELWRLRGGDPADVIPRLLRSYPGVRGDSPTIIRAMGRRALPVLREMLSGPEPSRHLPAMLAQIPCDESAELLASILRRPRPDGDDDNKRVRAYEDLRHRALRSLFDVGPATRAAVSTLTALLKADGNDGILTQVAQALGAAGGPEAVLALTESLRRAVAADPEKFVEFGSLEREGARYVFALLKLGPAAAPAAPLLVAEYRKAVLADAGWPPWPAQLGRPAIVPVAELLGDPEPRVRTAAAAVLGELGPDAEPAVERLIQRLADADPIVRSLAAEALGKIGPDARPAVPGLVKLLTDPAGEPQPSRGLFGPLQDGRVPPKLAAAHALVRLAPSGVVASVDWIRAMQVCLDDPGVTDGCFSVTGPRIPKTPLSSWAKELVPVLRERLLHPPLVPADEETGLFGRAWPAGEVEARLWLQIDPAGAMADPMARHKLARSSPGLEDVAALGPAAAPMLPVFEKLLRSESPIDRQIGLRGIWRIAGRPADRLMGEAADVLLSAGTNGGPADEDVDFPSAVAERIWPALEEAPEGRLGVLRLLLRRGGERERVLAAMILARLGGDARSAAADLRTVMRRDRRSTLRSEAAMALWRIEGAAGEVVPVLAECLLSRRLAMGPGYGPSDYQIPMRRRTAAYLGEIGSPLAVPALTEALSDADEETRAAAAEALGKVGPAAAPAVGELARRLTDPRFAVRRAAAAALGQVGPAAKAALPALEAAAVENDTRLREAAADAIAAIVSGRPPGAPVAPRRTPERLPARP